MKPYPKEESLQMPYPEEECPEEESSQLVESLQEPYPEEESLQAEKRYHCGGHCRAAVTNGGAFAGGGG